MPNWVSNNLTFTGSLEDLSALKKTLAMPAPIQFCAGQLEFHIFNFHSLISPAPELWDEYNGPEPDYKDIVDRMSHTSNHWYDWNTRNWGTKWEVCEESSHDNFDKELSSYTLTYGFNTAWSPPEGIMHALAVKLAELKLSSVQCIWEYQEEQGWGGSMNINEHGVDIIEQYDVPSSHNECEQRNGECWCVDTGEQIFDDCPPFDD